MPSARNPATSAAKSRGRPIVTGFRERRRTPRNKLKVPQSTFTSGEESPTPRGFENGEGNGVPLKSTHEMREAIAKKGAGKEIGNVAEEEHHKVLFCGLWLALDWV